SADLSAHAAQVRPLNGLIAYRNYSGVEIMKNKELDNILDQVTSGIRSENIDEATLSAAKERVSMKLSEGALRMSAAHPQGAGAPIEGCADFQALIPSHLAGELSEARKARVVVPQRTVRAGRARSQQYSIRPVVLRWGIAAALVIGLGLIAWPLVQRYVPFGSLEATVQAADGPLYLVSDAQTRELKIGEKINRGDVIRTSKDGHAVVRLGDGSTIEMKDRSEFSLNQTMRGTTVNLDRGSVIVEAAKQRNHMFVATSDSLVSVTGTTFAVNAGTKGSRVSVIEGEVHLDTNGKDRVLRPGEQATTNAVIETVPVKNEVAWSNNAARYSQILEGLAALKKDLNAVPKPGVRYSTRLLDMMPADTVLYASLPNLANTI